MKLGPRMYTNLIEGAVQEMPEGYPKQGSRGSVPETVPLAPLAPPPPRKNSGITAHKEKTNKEVDQDQKIQLHERSTTKRALTP